MLNAPSGTRRSPTTPSGTRRSPATPSGTRRPSSTRSAFSLAELVVAIGVLLFMFSLAGQVFSLTVRSTGQAMALTNTTQMLRAFEDTLREDLRRVDPDRTLLWIQGNPVNAYWTRDGQALDDDANIAEAGPATGYPHASDPSREYGPEDGVKNGDLVPPRADLLMFFTAGRAESAIPPYIRANQQLVLYGHATSVNYKRNPVPGDVAYEADPNTVIASPPLTPFPEAPASGSVDYISATAVSPVAAEDWTLARRGVLLVPTSRPPSPWRPKLEGLSDVSSDRALLRRDPNSTKPFVSEELFFGLTDVIWDFDFERQVLTPWRDPTSGLAIPPFYPPLVLWNESSTRPSATAPDVALRSALDDSPPAPLAATFAQQLLPNCASFKVEWALDPRSAFVAGRLDGVKRMIWIDPGDLSDSSKPDSANPLRELREACLVETNPLVKANLHGLLSNNDKSVSCEPSGDPSSLALRFGGIAGDAGLNDWAAPDGRPNVVLFGAKRCIVTKPGGTCDASGGFEPDPIFPVALRITVDVFDSERRLGRPIRHVMVIPIGG